MELTARSVSTPAFGQADLSNCEREQIHLAGSIQPHGALLVLREPDFVTVQASANAAEELGLDEPLLGRPVASLDGNLAECISPHLNVSMLQAMPLAVRCAVGRYGRLFDVMLHRPPHGGLVIELEPAATPVNRTRDIEDGIKRILAAYSLRALCDETTRIIRDLTGYDRVMAYRFDRDGHGEVFSEDRADHLEPYLGNRYPATDIPQIARRLYERNRVRVMVDVNYEPVPLIPGISPITGQPLDMSLCLLRSISPIHVQYLKNMGVGATLVISLMVSGRLWGLIACHHYEPRRVPFDLRVVCELLAETVGTRIAALESSMRGNAELAVRRLEQRLVEAIPREGDWRGALFDSGQSLLLSLGATGAALLFEGQVMVTGEVPGTQQLRAISGWLDSQRGWPVFSTASLGLDNPEFAELRAAASGLVAAKLSENLGEYLIWVRPERIRTVTWGGDPNKAVVTGDSPNDLSPRRSFAQWHQLVEYTSEPWSEADLLAARLIGDTVKDVIL
ncbi:MAG: GAF domain-containing protein, partial [Acetobacteraceae bacterium]|nr:GAF domain-containing protein [Acetobacteraceae bacterium]